VEGWVLRDVDNGSALIEGRQGIFGCMPAIRCRVSGDRRDQTPGRPLVVVTSKGLIVAR